MTDSPRTVGDVMTHGAVAVGRDAGFEEIVGTMLRWRVGSLPVLTGDGRVVGVVAEDDLLTEEELGGGDPGGNGPLRGAPAPARTAATAEQLMTAPAVCVHAGTTLAEAARAMARRRIRRLPVTDAEGILRGSVSRRDLLKVFLPADGPPVPENGPPVPENGPPVPENGQPGVTGRGGPPGGGADAGGSAGRGGRSTRGGGGGGGRP
ncbi:CBS domain-containing protein [Streptomyces sp. NBC_01476]|uniref:CBS domain-containing protein n=1 Tax=Streptomyces sp. NBC_01476 TaxID=2903881 RepID=UPI002E2F2CF2|nr:CBS domain-containing protein [Streptomyces sp. NBC_01476]